MRTRLLVIGLGLAIVLLAVGGWTIDALRYSVQLRH